MQCLFYLIDLRFNSFILFVQKNKCIIRNDPSVFFWNVKPVMVVFKQWPSGKDKICSQDSNRFVIQVILPGIAVSFAA